MLLSEEQGMQVRFLSSPLMKSICCVCDKRFKQLQNRNRKKCNACNTKLRRLRNKLKAIELLGGKCIDCGYNDHPAALEFHHKEPSEKEFSIGMVANKSWASIEKELKKCELVCSNCHKIKHSDRYDNEKLLKFL
jgi:hypothetical protein